MKIKRKQPIQTELPFSHLCQSTLHNWLTVIIPNSTMRCYSKHWRAFEKNGRERKRRPKEPLYKATSN